MFLRDGRVEITDHVRLTAKEVDLNADVLGVELVLHPHHHPHQLAATMAIQMQLLIANVLVIVVLR
ncbi:TPA: hypothetical protein DIV55_02705 [Patescibacteria group bacterium]|nr:hypothetical protein [Patescibacteria group bacterium]